MDLTNDYFDEIEYDMEHDNRIGEGVKDEYKKDNYINIKNLDEKSTKELEGLFSDNKSSDIDVNRKKQKDNNEKENKGDIIIKRKSLLRELKSNSKKDKLYNISKMKKDNIEL